MFSNFLAPHRPGLSARSVYALNRDGIGARLEAGLTPADIHHELSDFLTGAGHAPPSQRSFYYFLARNAKSKDEKGRGILITPPTPSLSSPSAPKPAAPKKEPIDSTRIIPLEELL